MLLKPSIFPFISVPDGTEEITSNCASTSTPTINGLSCFNRFSTKKLWGSDDSIKVPTSPWIKIGDNTAGLYIELESRSYCKKNA